MYNIRAYGRMITDKDRTEAYERALRQVVRPEHVVLDIGTGTGVFAMLACKLGARRVYAIDPDPVIQVAKENARANGFADRIEFFQASSTEVSLPERADVIVSDLRGILPVAGLHLPSIIDARQRFLAADGVLIPQKDVLRAALVESPKIYNDIIGPFEDHPLGLDASTERRFAVNRWYSESLEADHLMSDPAIWCEIDYRSTNNANAEGQMTFRTLRGGTAHGIAVWFDAQLTRGITYSSGPARKDSVYGTAFFPFLEPLQLNEAAEVSVALDARLVGDDYIWTWHTRHGDKLMEQSDFHGTPFSPAMLAKRAPSFAPRLGDDGSAVRLALDLMDGKRTNQEIAEILSSKHPEKFSRLEDALHLVGKLAAEHSR